MTQEIIEMAVKAGIAKEVAEVNIEIMQTFAKLAAEKEHKKFGDAAMKAAESAIDLAMALEREACAEILDANAMACNSPIMRSLLQSNAQAIRARGQA